MNRLEERIRDCIRQDGPMSISLYMTMCLHDPVDGYYATRPGLGRDFTTAPEISQVFGELIGAWAVQEWAVMGRPSPFSLVELGPGRGVMMADALRAASRAPGFLEAVRIVLIEASPALRALQAERLAQHRISHVTDLSEAPEGPMILLANEFLDCLPVRQFVKTSVGWRERCVGLDPDGGRMRLGLGGSAALPEGVSSQGDEAECSLGLGTLVDRITERFAAANGRALFIDYGDAHGAPRDSVRAFRHGRQIDPLSAPGESDLTADVDFDRLSRLARARGLIAHGPVPQGEFLNRLGARERFTQLAQLNPTQAEQLEQAQLRLMHPSEMGARFQVMCLAPEGAATPTGFDAASACGQGFRP